MENKQLRKNIGFSVAISLVIGTVIGSGIFMKPGIVISSAGNSTLALLAWIIGGIITLASGLTIAEVSVRIPKTGGLFHYVEEAYGKFWGFLCGWVQTLVYGPALMGALALYFGTLVTSFFGLPDYYKIIIGIATAILIVIFNLLGTNFGGWIQNISTIGKLIPIILIIIFGIFSGHTQILHMTSGVTQNAGFGAAVLATLWAYDGWMNVGYMAGEMENPSKTLPKAITFGILTVIIAYLTVNISMLHVLSADKIVALGPNAAGAVATILFGNVGGKIITIGIMISIFGCLNGKILTFPRVPFSMAENGMLPAGKIISSISTKFKTPVGATILELIIAILMMLLGNPDELSNIAIFAVFLFYTLAFISIFILRRKNVGETNLYKVPLYPFTPIIAIIGAIYIILSTLISSPLETIMSIVIAIIGIPFYLYRLNK